MSYFTRMSTVLKSAAVAATTAKPTRSIRFKTDEDQHLVYGELYVPGFPDSQGDYMTAHEVQKMAHRYLTNGGSPDFGAQCVDINHDGVIRQCEIVESFIARKGDPDFIEGSWVICAHISDEAIWQSIKKGEFNGFSMEALIFDELDLLEVEFPDSIQGTTYKADDGDEHTHVYTVKLDASGQIINGRTDMVNGHYHLIQRGTITEPANGHKHRFSFLDEITFT